MIVSVVLPTLNGEKFLKCQIGTIIESCVYAKVKYEIIVGDDGSVDSTERLILDLIGRHPEIKLVRVGRKNLVHNLNRLLALCSGEVIFFSDQDDIWYRDCVARHLVEHYQNNVDAVIHSFDFIDEMGCRLCNASFVGSFGFFGNLWKNKVKGSVLSLSRKVLSSILPLPDGLPHDHFIGLMVSLHNYNALCIEESLSAHRLHGHNVSKTGVKSDRRLWVIAFERLKLIIRVIIRKRSCRR